VSEHNRPKAGSIHKSVADHSVASELAELLTSGVTGMQLLAKLRERFPHAGRADVFFGVAIAISLFEADRIELLAELLAAEKSEGSDGR
jgi:hypothetical protein